MNDSQASRIDFMRGLFRIGVHFNLVVSLALSGFVLLTMFALGEGLEARFFHVLFGAQGQARLSMISTGTSSDKLARHNESQDAQQKGISIYNFNDNFSSNFLVPYGWHEKKSDKSKRALYFSIRNTLPEDKIFNDLILLGDEGTKNPQWKNSFFINDFTLGKFNVIKLESDIGAATTNENGDLWLAPLPNIPASAKGVSIEYVAHISGIEVHKLYWDETEIGSNDDGEEAQKPISLSNFQQWKITAEKIITDKGQRISLKEDGFFTIREPTFGATNDSFSYQLYRHEKTIRKTISFNSHDEIFRVPNYFYQLKGIPKDPFSAGTLIVPLSFALDVNWERQRQLVPSSFDNIHKYFASLASLQDSFKASDKRIKILKDEIITIEGKLSSVKERRREPGQQTQEGKTALDIEENKLEDEKKVIYSSLKNSKYSREYFINDVSSKTQFPQDINQSIEDFIEALQNGGHQISGYHSKSGEWVRVLWVWNLPYPNAYHALKNIRIKEPTGIDLSKNYVARQFQSITFQSGNNASYAGKETRTINGNPITFRKLNTCKLFKDVQQCFVSKPIIPDSTCLGKYSSDGYGFELFDNKLTVNSIACSEGDNADMPWCQTTKTGNLQTIPLLRGIVPSHIEACSAQIIREATYENIAQAEKGGIYFTPGPEQTLDLDEETINSASVNVFIPSYKFIEDIDSHLQRHNLSLSFSKTAKQALQKIGSLSSLTDRLFTILGSAVSLFVIFILTTTYQNIQSQRVQHVGLLQSFGKANGDIIKIFLYQTGLALAIGLSLIFILVLLLIGILSFFQTLNLLALSDYASWSTAGAVFGIIILCIVLELLSTCRLLRREPATNVFHIS